MLRTHLSAPRRLRQAHVAFILSLVAIASFAACSPKKTDGRRYDLKGKVVSVDRAKELVTINHEEVKGYMPAMTMEYPLRDEEALKVVDAGDQIQATLVVADDNTYWLEDPVITKALPGANNSSQTSGGTEPQTGAEVPDVMLVNQDGRQISTRQFRGRALLVTFVYTRCPSPDQCPLMSANFAQVNAALQGDADLKKKAHLLSVTLDPEYDKPEVLRSYGAAYAGGKFDDWDFATGDPADVRRFAEFFGLMYQRDNGQLIHSLRTAVITPDGKLYKIYRGNEWKPDDAVRDLKDAAGKDAARKDTAAK